MMRKHRIAFVVSLFLLFLFIIFTGLFCVSHWNRINTKDDTERHEYLKSEFDPTTNSTKKKTVRISRSLSHGESISYRRDDGVFVMISEISDVDYDCTGSCYCGDTNRRSVALGNIQLLGRGFLFILSAVSLSLAINHASKYYEDECKNKFSEVCPLEKIFAEIDDCKEKIEDEGLDPENMTSDKVIEEVKRVTKEFGQVTDKRYSCKGFCTSAKDYLKVEIFDEPHEMNPMEFDDDLLGEAWKVLSQPELIEAEKRLQCKELFIEQEIDALSSVVAQFEFDNNVLSPYCTTVGMVKYNDDGITRPVSVCLGSIDTVDCVPLDPTREFD